MATNEGEQNNANIVKEVSDAREEIVSELKNVMQRFNDPVFIGSLLYRTVAEKENTNRLLKNIFARLDSLDERLKQLEQKPERPPVGPKPEILPEIDERIVEFVRSRGRVCAEDVQKALKYRGKNAASSRMNRLFQQGILEKAQAGRKVYYTLRE